MVDELSSEFGGVTFNPEFLRGVWQHQGQRFEENNIKLVIDVEDTPENADFFARYKQLLKERFRQIDIWIVSHEVRIT